MRYDTSMQKNKFLAFCPAMSGVVGLTFVPGITNEKPQSREEVIDKFTNLYYASNVHYRTKLSSRRDLHSALHPGMGLSFGEE